MAGDLLPSFTVSSKVGFFPGHSHAEHSLGPGLLLRALEKTNADLGRTPDLVFLHNPERSLVRFPEHAPDVLAEACGALQEATAKGLCREWGIATWNPSPLTDLINPATPRPSVLMVRSGLLVSAATLDAADTLADRWKPGAVWGMSPFGGDTDDPVWDTVDPRLFLRSPSEQCSRVQAAFRVAYDLPSAVTVAVGTDNPDHLTELLAALPYEVDSATIHRYRTLLRDRARTQPD